MNAGLNVCRTRILWCLTEGVALSVPNGQFEAVPAEMKVSLPAESTDPTARYEC